MRLLKISSVMLFSILIITSFQNCSQANFAGVNGLESAKIDANDFNNIGDVRTADQTTSSTPDPLNVAADECLPAGHVFTTNNGLPQITYRKCNGELEHWQNYGKAACCSGKASIVDKQVYSDSVCRDGLYIAVMTCQ